MLKILNQTINLHQTGPIYLNFLDFVFFRIFNFSFLGITISGGKPLKLGLAYIHKTNCNACTMSRSNPLQK